MTSYKTRKPITILFVTVAIVVVVLSLLASNLLIKELAKEERNKMEVWALATQSMINEQIDASLVLKILQTNTTIPLILHDKSNNSLESHNIKIPANDIDLFLHKKIEKFEKKHEPIILEEMDQVLYYNDSHTLRLLQLYPYLNLFVISVFIALAFFTLNRSQRAEQNRVWVGLSKETAHQLGTPISSLMAWTEYLKLKDVDDYLLSEIDKDIDRLQMIAERFSKIGFFADLHPSVFQLVVRESVSYMEKRLSNKVTFKFLMPDKPITVMLNVPLFDWVIENLTKNAVDAMRGEGEIAFTISYDDKYVFLDIADNGKGIPRNKYNAVFMTGYTTKERGWGLGLSLVKRIVEVNHKGRIYIKESQEEIGTIFRIKLPKSV